MTDRSPETLVDQLSLEEQISLLAGQDFWSVNPIPRLEIGTLRVTDGPNGARGGGSLVGGVSAAAFPVGIAIGASWNPDLAFEIGAAIAQEVKSKNAHVSLAPTVNIHRSVTNGRNFECYSEDPELTTDLAVAYVKGLQSEGVSATIKHYAGNESEYQRTTINSVIDERSLREIYLRPFEGAVKEAGTWGVMSSYNRLNGPFASENPWLLTDVLRGDWGYDGIVMSDWFGSHSTAETVNAGLDLEMPGPTRDRGDKLLAAVDAGKVSPEMIRERALNMLRLMARVGSLDDHREFEERAEDRPEHRALIRRAGAEGMVMLKNDGVLPLTGAAKTVAVIGPNADVAQIMGGGSAQLNPHYAVSPLEGITARLGADRVRFAKGCTNHRWEPVLKGQFTAEFFANTTLEGEPANVIPLNDINQFWVPPIAGGAVQPNNFSARITGTFIPETSGLHRIGAHAAGYYKIFVDGALVMDVSAETWVRGHTFFEEGNDAITADVEMIAGKAHKIVIEFAARPSDNLTHSALYIGLSRPLNEADISEAAAVAAEADAVVLCLGRSGEWDTEGWDLPSITLPGAQDALAEAVLAANPNTVIVLQTGGPCEMPWVEQARGILQAWYPGQEAGNAIADVLFGDAEPGGRLPQSFPVAWADNPTGNKPAHVYPGENGEVVYEEGLFIGYRHYDAKGITPLYPFGHGLSYTSFTLSNFNVAPEAGMVTLSADLENTGKRSGSTVVQAYVAPKNAPVTRPKRELKGFVKQALEAGNAAEIVIPLDLRDFAYFDVDAQNWHVAAGDYEIQVGFSANDIVATETITLAEHRLEK